MGFKNTTAPDFSKIPDELKRFPNWVCWQGVPNEKSHSGLSKKPIDAKTGQYARSNDPTTWCDFDTAVNAAPSFSGIGFMFSNSPYFGVDLDDMKEEVYDFKCGGTGGRVGEFMRTLHSYAEMSQSGTGIHIICKGALPEGKRHVPPIEMYDNGRFFVMTGNCYGGYTDICDCTESIKPLHEKYLGATKPLTVTPAPMTADPGLMSIDDILERALNAKNGEKLSRLMSGDISDYGSQSEADMALCNILAFWTGKDAEKMDIIFRHSGLMRDKWDRRQSGTTYGAITIAKAISECSTIYTPGVYTPSSGIGQTGQTGQSEPSDNPNAAVRHYTMDDMGNASRFVDLYGGAIRYSYTDKKWLYYDGKKWCTDYDGTSMRLADCSIEAMKLELKSYLEEYGEDGDVYKAFQKQVKSSRSHKSKENMLKEVQHHVPIMTAQLDRYSMALNTPGGVINLKTGEVKPHSAEYYLTKMTDAELSERAECGRWKAFLEEIFLGDLDLIRYIQKAVGYSLTGSIAEQCAFFLYGTGRNGKSTFLEIIREIFGSYAANVQPETLMVKPASSTGINSDIARLKGARLVTSSEPNEGVRLNEGLIKQLTGGEPITARMLYGNEFEFNPEFKLWMGTNHKPVIRGTDNGIWRRVHLIPFNATIPQNKVDKDLKNKLRKELGGIFRWALDGCLLWQSEGLKMPGAVLAAVKEYRREMDVISAFIEDKCELTGAEQSSKLYACYAQWAADNNEYCMSATKFSLELSKKFEKVKTMSGAFFNGISLQ